MLRFEEEDDEMQDAPAQLVTDINQEIVNSINGDEKTDTHLEKRDEVLTEEASLLINQVKLRSSSMHSNKILCYAYVYVHMSSAGLLREF